MWTHTHSRASCLTLLALPPELVPAGAASGCVNLQDAEWEYDKRGKASPETRQERYQTVRITV